MLIKKQILFSILTSVFISVFLIQSYSINANENSFPYIGIVSTDKLGVFPRKSDDARKIAELSQNELITVLSKEEDWLEIKPPEKISCWISADYIKDGILTGSMVNVRDGSGLSNRVIAQLSKGEKVKVLQEITNTENEKWVQIEPPQSIKVWVKASGVGYFSDMQNVSAQLNKLESSRQLYDAASLYAKSELAKENYDSIDFDGIKERFYRIILETPETAQAQKALVELYNVDTEQVKKHAVKEEKENIEKARELFSEAESDRQSSADAESTANKYMDVIKTAPQSEQAKLALGRLASIRKQTGGAVSSNEQSSGSQIAMKEADAYFNQELSKKSESINYDSIADMYEDIADRHPNTQEASKAEEKIEFIKKLKSQSKYKISGAKKGNFYGYEGHLSQSGIIGDKTVYSLEERGLFGYKKVICLFQSKNDKVKDYINSKVRAEGSIEYFDKDTPFIALSKLELRK